MEKFKSLSKENTYEVEQKILKEWQNINILEKYHFFIIFY